MRAQVLGFRPGLGLLEVGFRASEFQDLVIWCFSSFGDQGFKVQGLWQVIEPETYKPKATPGLIFVVPVFPGLKKSNYPLWSLGLERCDCRLACSSSSASSGFWNAETDCGAETGIGCRSSDPTQLNPNLRSSHES